LKVTYTEEAVADIVDAIAYLNERNPTAAAKLDADIARCIERLADQEFEEPVSRLRSGVVVRSWVCRRSGSAISAIPMSCGSCACTTSHADRSRDSRRPRCLPNKGADPKD
jgi:ParE toxin of type II toxin-antitoxin system, parDE